MSLRHGYRNVPRSAALRLQYASFTNTADVLENRKLIHDTTCPNLRPYLSTPRTVYCGFDPTAPALHLGNMLAILGLLHFQRGGHKTIALLGGGTGLVGDPSGRSTERTALEEATVNANLRAIEDDIRRVEKNANELFPVQEGPIKPIEFVNNREWYKEYDPVSFLLKVGRHFRLSTMLAKESVRQRMATAGGLSLAEFLYQVFQAYDFFHLHQQYGCDVQVGGSDQLGNITAGTDLIRRIEQKDVHGVVFPLLTTSAGVKFGKSMGNALWLKADMTSPYHLYQFLMQTADEDTANFLLQLTLLPMTEAKAIQAEHMMDKGKRIGQRELAKHITLLVHGEDELVRVEKATAALFRPNPEDSASASDILTVLGDAPTKELSKAQLDGCSIVDLAVVVGAYGSKSNARKAIKAGGLYVNNKRVQSAEQRLDPTDALDGSVTIVRSGKKNHFVVRWK